MSSPSGQGKTQPRLPVHRLGNCSVFLTGRLSVYGMTVGSPLDEQEIHSPDYLCTGGATVQSSIKHILQNKNARDRSITHSLQR